MTKTSKSKSTVDPVQTKMKTEPLSIPEKKESEQNSQLSEIEQIRQAAYARYEARQYGNGDPEQDWFEAEAEVAARRLRTVNTDKSSKESS